MTGIEDASFWESLWRQTAGPLVPGVGGLVGWWILVGALLWDWAYGEMPPSIHPVVWMGKPIRWVKTFGLRNSRHPWAQFLIGTAASAVIPLFFAVGGALIMTCARDGGGGVFEIFMGAFLLKSSFAQRALGEAGNRVGRLLDKAPTEGLDPARRALRALCSRDASTLNAGQLTQAAISSLAENLSDSVLAPLCFYLVAGIPGALFYRVVNTMDAVLGYRGSLEYLGKTPARFDDLLNWIPARVTCLCLIVAAPVSRWIPTLGVVGRCARTTPSPNGGWPMAAMAGSLGVRLEKVGVYVLDGRVAGQVTVKPKPSADGALIQEAWALAVRAVAVFFGLLACIVGTVMGYLAW